MEREPFEQMPSATQISLFEIKQEDLQPKQETEIPKMFTEEYYFKNIARCDEKSDNDYRWRSLRHYAGLVKSFYFKLTEVFNKTLDKPIELPTYMQRNPILTELDELAQKLEEQEIKTLKCFKNDTSKIERKCERHQTLRSLRECGAKCWMLYHNLKRENFYSNIIGYKTKIHNEIKSEDAKTALVYSHHIKTKNFITTKVKNYFSKDSYFGVHVNLHPATINFYANMKAEPLFDEIIEFFGGYDFRKNEEEQEEKIATVKDENALMVIELFKNYSDIKKVYKNLIHTNKDLKEYYNQHIFMAFHDWEDSSIDFFNKAKDYLNLVCEIEKMAKENVEYSFVVDDCKHLSEKLGEAINMNEKFHEEMLQERKEARMKIDKGLLF